MRAKSLQRNNRSSVAQNKRSLSRVPRRFLQNKERDSNQEYVRSLITDLESKSIFTLTTAVKELTDIYLANENHELFFSRQVPIRIFQIALQNPQNARIFCLAQTFLKAFMESCASQSSYNFSAIRIGSPEYGKAKCLNSFLNYIGAQLDENEMLYNIYFYILVGEIISTPNACVPFAHTLAPVHFIQAYITHVCNSLDMCSQTANTLSIKQLNQIQNTSSEEEASVNSDLTMASSLSLDEDATLYTTYKQLDDTLSEISSARSILSKFAETAFGNAASTVKKGRKGTASYARLPVLQGQRSKDSDSVSDQQSSADSDRRQLILDAVDEKQDVSSYYSEASTSRAATDLGSDRSKDFDEDGIDADAALIKSQPLSQDNSTESGRNLHYNAGDAKPEKSDVATSAQGSTNTSMYASDFSLAFPTLGDVIQDLPRPEQKEADARCRLPVTRAKKTRLPPQPQIQPPSQAPDGQSSQVGTDIGTFSEVTLKDATLRDFNCSVPTALILADAPSEVTSVSKGLQPAMSSKLLSFTNTAIPKLDLQQRPLFTNEQESIAPEEKSSPARQLLTTARRQSRYVIGTIHTAKGRTNALSNNPNQHTRIALSNTKVQSTFSTDASLPPLTPSAGAPALNESPFNFTQEINNGRDHSNEFSNVMQGSKGERRAICGPLAQVTKTMVQRPSIVPLLKIDKPAQQRGETPDLSKDTSNPDLSKDSQKKSTGVNLTLDLRSVRESESTTIPISHRGFPGRTVESDALNTSHHAKSATQTVNDFVFNKYLQVLSERRKGIPKLADVASRIGEYTFMRDYPLLCSLSGDKSFTHSLSAFTERSVYSNLSVLTTSTSPAARANYIITNLYTTTNYAERLNEHKRKHFIHKLFDCSYVRDLSEYHFDFSVLSSELLHLVRLHRIDLSKENVIRLGVSYILHQCIKNLSGIVTKYLPNILPSICTDLISLHQRKLGFIPAVVLALSSIANQIHIATQSNIKTSWTKVTVKVYDYIDLTYDYIDLKTSEYIDEEDLQDYRQNAKLTSTCITDRSLTENANASANFLLVRNVAKRHNVTLPDDMFVLQRLEAQRRMYCIDMYTISLRLKTLVLIPHSMSACDDIACYLAVITDRLATSQSNPMVRGLVTTTLLPSLLKLIEMLQTRSIKSRLHYILIAQRILEVMSLLASDSFLFIPSLVMPSELLASRALVNNNLYFTTDQSMQNIDNLLCDVLLFDDANIPWLRRYSYLIFLNTRVKEELSGMYYNRLQCQHSFETYKVKFARYIITIIRLLRQRFLKLAQQVSVHSKLETTRIFTATSHDTSHNLPVSSHLAESSGKYTLKLSIGSTNVPVYVTKYANLPENGYPKGKEDITGYTYETKLKHLPINSLVNLCTLEKHANVCTNMNLEHVALTRCDESHRINVKELLRDNDCHNIISSLSFLFDFETGVFPQYLVLTRNEQKVPKTAGTLTSPKQTSSCRELDLFKVIPTAETMAEARTQHTAAKELLNELSKGAFSEPTSRMSVLFVLHAISEFFTIENVDLYLKPTDIRKFISFHYNSFLKLYNDCEADLLECVMNSSSSVSLLDLCNGHLNVLCSLVQMNSSHIRQYFYELRIMHFLIMQLSVESKDSEVDWQKTVSENDAATLRQINVARADAKRQWTMDSAAASPLLPPVQMQQTKKPGPLSLNLNLKNTALTSASSDNGTMSSLPSLSSLAPSMLPKGRLTQADTKNLAPSASSSPADEQLNTSIFATSGRQESKGNNTIATKLGNSVTNVITPSLNIKSLTDDTSLDSSMEQELTDYAVTDHLKIGIKNSRFSDLIGQDTILSADTSFDYQNSAAVQSLKLPSLGSGLLSLPKRGPNDSSVELREQPSQLATVTKHKAHLYDSSDSDSCWEAEAKRLDIDFPSKKLKRQQSDEDLPKDVTAANDLQENKELKKTQRSQLSIPVNNLGLKLNLSSIEKQDRKRESPITEQPLTQSIFEGISQFEKAANVLNPKFHLFLGNKIAAELETAHTATQPVEIDKSREALPPREQDASLNSKSTNQKGKQQKNTKSVLKKDKFSTVSNLSLATQSSAAPRPQSSVHDKVDRKSLVRSATSLKLVGLVGASDSLDVTQPSQSLQNGVQSVLFAKKESAPHPLLCPNPVYHNSVSDLGVSDTPLGSKPIDLSNKVFQKPLYVHEELRYTILRMILQLIIIPETGALDPMYCSQFPANDGMLNILWILHHHLNHPINERLALRLISSDISTSSRRLLRLLCYNLFDATLYPIKDNTRFTLMAQGAFGSVYAGNVALVTEENQKCQSFLTPVAVKIQDMSKSPYDRCVLHDIFNEITVMEKLANYSGVSRMYDYGVTHDGYYIIMHRYVTSLKDLRLKLFDDSENGPNSQLLYHSQPQYKRLPIYGHEMSYMRYIRIYLLIFIKFLRHLSYLHTNGVNHYDIKADNVFFDPRTAGWYLTMAEHATSSKGKEEIDIDGPLSKEFLSAFFDSHKAISSYELLPFKITIADFGESMIFSDEESSYTIINKGTEYNKSPEMLLSANMVAQTRSNFDRRRPKGAGSSSDVWSAACFLYELLTGDILFFDSDWIRFFIRVTKDSYQSNVRARGRDRSAAESFTFSCSEKFAQLYRGVSLSPEKKAMLGNCQPIIDLLEFCLVPNPTLRPKIRDVIVMTEHILSVYFPVTYTYKAERYYVEPVPNVPFISSNFCFSIIGSVDECLANPREVLAPKLSVVKQSDEQPGAIHITSSASIANTEQIITDVNGSLATIHEEVQAATNSKLDREQRISLFLSQVLPPVTDVMDGLAWIGSSAALNSVELLLAHNITSVIDCLQSLELSTTIKRNLEITNLHYYKLPSILIQIVKHSSKGEPIIQPQANMLQLSKESFLEYYQALDETLDFIRSTVVHGGRCLLYDEDGLGLSSAVAIAILVEFRSLSLLAALLHVKHLRPHVSPPIHFMDFLHYWFVFRIKPGIKHKHLLSANLPSFKTIQFKVTPSYEQLLNLRITKARYQCLCGKIFFIIKPGIKHTPHFVLCNCTYTPSIAEQMHSSRGKGNWNPICPTHSCRSILNLLMSIHGLRLTRILWAFVPAHDVLSNWKKATTSIYHIPSVPDSIECSIESPKQAGFTGLDDMRAPIGRIPMQQHWELYYCKICGMITHAADNSHSNDVRLAIVANFSPK